jgi:thiamine pyrophosphate-dependent acetolactate synthase large subunit-like protein
MPTRRLAGLVGRSRSTPTGARLPCGTSSSSPTRGACTPRTSSTISGGLTEGQALVVTDVGQHQNEGGAQYYHHDRPRRLITSGGLGPMGFSLPAALGAKLACPDEEVWVIVATRESR